MADQLQQLQDIQTNTFKQNKQLLDVNTNIAEQLKLQLEAIQAAKDAKTPVGFSYDKTLSGIATKDGFKFTDTPDFKLTMANGDIIKRDYKTLDEMINGLKDLVTKYPTEYLYNQAQSAIAMYSKINGVIPKLNGYLDITSLNYNTAGNTVYSMMQDLGKTVSQSKTAASYAEALAWDNAYKTGQLSENTKRYYDANMIMSGYSDNGAVYHVGSNQYGWLTKDLGDMLGSLVGIGKTDVSLGDTWYRYKNSLNDGSQGYRYPSYAVGTSYVPEDQLAQVHQGEAILPVDHAKIYRENGLNNGNDSNLLKELITEVKDLKSQNAILVDITDRYVQAEAQKDRKLRAEALSA